MLKMFALTKVLFKNSFSIIDQGNNKQSKKLLSYLLIGFILVSFIPSLYAFYFLTQEAVKMLLPLQQQGVVIGLIFQLASTMVLFFGVFLIPAVFYFSKDIETLLPLPLSPVQLLSSKFLVAYVYDTVIILLFITPFILAYYSVVSFSLIEILFLIIGLLTFTLVPLILVSLLVMVIMSSVDLFKNRDLFNMLSGVIMLGIVISINMAVGGFANVTQSELLTFLLEGNNSLLQIFQFVIPSIPFLIKAILESAWISMALYVFITLGIVALFLLFGHILYFKGVIGINESASKRKRLTQKQLSASSRKTMPMISYWLKEIRLLWRTPVYFLNCISVNLLLPAIIMIPLFMGQDVEGLDLSTLLPLGDPLILNYVIVLGIGLGLVFGTINMISSTTISREGSGFYFMKLIPMSYMEQFHSKAFSGIFFSWLGILIVSVPLVFVRGLPFNLLFTMILFAFLSSVFINYFSLLVDVIRPKLVWESEQAAVKQNLNFLFTLAPASAIAFGLGYVIYRFYIPPFYVVIGASLGIVIDLIGIIFLLKSVGIKALQSRNA